jgi:photosystem II stability/assembly factor-like uncharacterized protein
LFVSHNRCFRLLLIVLTALGYDCAAQQQIVTADGIFAHGNAVILFTKVSALDCMEPQADAAQIFVSTDQGKTWTKRGPAIDGSEFQYVLGTGGKLWVVGIHIAEGPAIDPFILAPVGAAYAWRLRRIYSDPSWLQGVAFRGKSTLIAWVSHVSLEAEDWTTGPTYAYESVNGGVSWKRTHRVKSVPKREPSLRFFQKISKQSGDWMTVDLDEGGFVVKHRDGPKAPWKTVSEFHTPDCPP